MHGGDLSLRVLLPLVGSRPRTVHVLFLCSRWRFDVLADLLYSLDRRKRAATQDFVDKAVSRFAMMRSLSAYVAASTRSCLRPWCPPPDTSGEVQLRKATGV